MQYTQRRNGFFHLLFICVCVCVHVCAHAQEARGQPWVSLRHHYLPFCFVPKVDKFMCLISHIKFSLNVLKTNHLWQDTQPFSESTRKNHL